MSRDLEPQRPKASWIPPHTHTSPLPLHSLSDLELWPPLRGAERRTPERPHQPLLLWWPHTLLEFTLGPDSVNARSQDTAVTRLYPHKVMSGSDKCHQKNQLGREGAWSLSPQGRPPRGGARQPYRGAVPKLSVGRGVSREEEARQWGGGPPPKADQYLCPQSFPMESIIMFSTLLIDRKKSTLFLLKFFDYL